MAYIFYSISTNIICQCTSEYINTKDNMIANDLPHVKFANLVSTLDNLLQAHVELRSCERCHLNPDFISCIMHIDLLDQSPLLSQLSGVQTMRTIQLQFIKWCIKTRIHSHALTHLDMP